MDDGAPIRVVRHGNPSGPRVVLGHGNGFASDSYFPFWRRMPSIPGLSENGGFIRATVGRSSDRRCRIDSALWQAIVLLGKRPARRPARTAAISLRCSAPAAPLPSAS